LSWAATKIFGSIEILVNNGGMSVRRGTIETQLSVHQRLMNVNYFGSLELTHHIASHMAAAGSGNIVTPCRQCAGQNSSLCCQ
jgi:short-subunit dehydrogenase